MLASFSIEFIYGYGYIILLIVAHDKHASD